MSGAHGTHHGEHEGSSKKIGLLIALLALVLAVSETLGKGAQTSALNYNIEAANLWSFFQGKTIRMTAVRTAAEQAQVNLATLPTQAPGREAIQAQIEAWKKSAVRYDTEPETGEGRKELMARAKATENKRDQALSAYHKFELGSAAVQVAIVLASASIITGVAALAWIAGGLGALGIGFCVLGAFWPTMHFF